MDFGCGLRVAGGGSELIDGARPHRLGRRGEHLAVAACVAGLDQLLDARARQRADGVGEETIDPLAARVRRCHGGEAVWHGGEYAVPEGARHRHGCGDRGGDDGADRVDRAPDRGAPAAAPAVATSVLLEEPVGTRIAAIAAVGDRLAVQLQGGGADRIVLLDTHSGAVVGRVGLRGQP